MSFHRAVFVAIATFFTISMTSAAAFACGGCGGCGWGGGCGVSYAPIAYAAPVRTYAVPVTTYAQPLAPAPIRVGGCGCGAGLFVVNQGPEYSGPGLMEPYRLYRPSTAYAPRAAYPYIGRHWAHPYYGARYAYRGRAFYGSRSYGRHVYHAAPQWHLYSHRP